MARRKKKKEINIDLTAIGMIIFGIILAIIVYSSDLGGLGNFIKFGILGGLFGKVTMAIPIVLIVLGLYIMFRDFSKLKLKTFQVIILTISVAGIFTLVDRYSVIPSGTEGLFSYIVAFYKAGANHEEMIGGGVLGGIISIPLYLWFNKYVAYAILIGLVTVSSMLITGITLSTIIIAAQELISEMLSESKKEYVENSNIIYIDFNLDKFDELKEYKELINYVSSKYEEGKNNFILIDEVQMCNGFEKAINNFHAEKKYDIYITGSNAFLLSSDLATLFTGRTYSIEVYPFSYKEFLKYHDLDNNEESYDRFVLEGGFSGSYLYKDIDKKYNYIRDVYKTMIVRDIITRNKIQNIPLLDSISDFLIDNISRLTSYRSLTDTLNTNKADVNDKTVGTYVKYLCEAFAFYRIRRYDIQGKKYLVTQDKYYLSDHAVKYAIQGTKNMNYGSVYENIVAMELLRRGYEVYVGVLYEKEIDFVAMKRNEKIYIQVSDNIGNDFENETFKREVTPLLQIKDAYPKMIIARTKHDDYQYEGVQIVDISNWLIRDN